MILQTNLTKYLYYDMEYYNLTWMILILLLKLSLVPIKVLKM